MYVLFLYYSEKKEKKVKLVSSEFVDKEEQSAPTGKKKSKNKFKGKLVVVRQAKLKNQICASKIHCLIWILPNKWKNGPLPLPLSPISDIYLYFKICKM